MNDIGEEMPGRWLGLVVGSDEVVAVDADVPASGPLTLQADLSWSLQRGDRAIAYKVMHQHVTDYVRDHDIERVVIKASAVSLAGTRGAHLRAAELRGVVAAAAAVEAETTFIAKNHISKTFGARKVDEYVKDNSFWPKQVSGGKLRVGSREAAMMLLAARNEK